MFSGDHLIEASLDEDLRHGFLSTYSLVDFFTYRYDQFPERVRKWIWDDERLAGADAPTTAPAARCGAGSRAARCPRAARSTSGPATWS